jgi:hypothetical protein
VGPCYSCGQNGHYANRCPRTQANQTPTPDANQNLNHSANNSATTPARQNQAHAHVNHVAMEDAKVALDAIISMIHVSDNNAIVLFDSGASLSVFIASERYRVVKITRSYFKIFLQTMKNYKAHYSLS